MSHTLRENFDLNFQYDKNLNKRTGTRATTRIVYRDDLELRIILSMLKSEKSVEGRVRLKSCEKLRDVIRIEKDRRKEN